MTPWPLNKPLLPTTDLNEVEASMRVWEGASPSQLKACWEGPLQNASVLRATLDDRRLELLALRLARAYQKTLADASPQDIFAHEVLADVVGPHLSAGDKEEGYRLMSAGWQMTYRARYSNTKVKPVTKLLELLSPYWGWPDSAGVSWLAGWGLAVSRRFKTGLLVELSSPKSALESVMTRQHRLRRRAGELDAAWPQVANKVSSPRM